jgi:ABC-2 type transport system permease protein
MTTLVGKLFRDLRLPLCVVAVLLALFQCLWARISQRITEELVPSFAKFVPIEFIKTVLFEGPGKLLQTMMGGESINFAQAADMLSIGYVHPLMQTIFCIWAIGRAAGAISGEIDRGTMELLLSQPLPRYRVILAHLCVDLLTIPILCLSLWAGNWLGIGLFGHIGPETDSAGKMQVDPLIFGPALWNVAALLFAVTGYTMWLSARGRFRGKVMGVAVLVTLLQFLVNVIGQLWDVLAPLRPFTVFFYYQPQQIILKQRWTVDLGQVWNHGQPFFAVNVLALLFLVGGIGYGLALWTFCRRDLPSPL